MNNIFEIPLSVFPPLGDEQ